MNLAELALFEGCTRRELFAARVLGTRIDLTAGRPVMVEGTPGSEYVVVTAGQVAVSRRDRPIDVLGPGAGCGELAMLAPPGVGRRYATVTALTDLEMLVYDRREFRGLLARVPTAAARIEADAVERLVAHHRSDQG